MELTINGRPITEWEEWLRGELELYGDGQMPAKAGHVIVCKAFLELIEKVKEL